jgi:hypothetical protein
MLNLFLMRASRLFTKKKDLKTNRRDALIAEKQENSRETILATTDILTTDTKQQRRVKSPFFVPKMQRHVQN